MKTIAEHRGRISFALGMTVAAVLVVLVFPGVGIGAPTSSHGGSPSDVYMQTQSAPESCAEVPPDSLLAFPLDFELDETSHVLAYFTFEWAGLNSHEVGSLNLVLDDVGPGPTWESTPARPRVHPSGMVMWSFPNVAPGAHTVAVYAAVDAIDPLPGGGEPFGALENCSMTVFVMPPV